MKKTITIAMASASLIMSAHAATLATWTDTTTGDNKLEGTDVSVNVTTSDTTLNVLSGTSTSSTTVPNGDIFIIHDNDTDNSGQTIAQAVTNGQYIEFTFTVSGLSAGEVLQVDGVSYGVRRNANGTDRHGSELSQAWVNGALIDTQNAHADGTTYQFANSTTNTYTNGQTFTGRVYLAGFDDEGAASTDNNGAIRVGNIIVTGDVVPVPEPTSAALLGLGGLALILRRRK